MSLAFIKQSFKDLISLQKPLQLWILCHPFAARKAQATTSECRKIADEMIFDSDLDGDAGGGQVDAFRHLFWMASLTQIIGARKALSLGKAHEKGNEADFREKKLEEQFLPTFISCKMDYINNALGSGIGVKYPNVSRDELIQIVKTAILKGDAVIVKKDSRNRFLDSRNNIIPENEYVGLWHSSKTLVPSNFRRPK